MNCRGSSKISKDRLGSPRICFVLLQDPPGLGSVLKDSFEDSLDETKGLIGYRSTFNLNPADELVFFFVSISRDPFRDPFGILVHQFKSSLNRSLTGSRRSERHQVAHGVGVPTGIATGQDPGLILAGSFQKCGNGVGGGVGGRCEPVALTLQANRISRLVTSELLDL